MIDYNGGHFSPTPIRPAWTTALKKRVVDAYNEKHGTQYNHRTVRLNDLALDRAHRISFKTIQNWLVYYLERQITGQKLCYYTDLVFDASTVGGLEIQCKRDELIQLVKQGKTGEKLLATANALLRLLNSSVRNVDLGDASLNRGIQEHFDPNFEVLHTNPGPSYSASPRTRSMLDSLTRGESGGVALTPGTTRVLASQVGRPVPRKDLTPRSGALVDKHGPK